MHEKKNKITGVCRSRLYCAVIFENGVFTLKTHQMFSALATPEKSRNGTISGHFASVFEENS